VGIIKPKFYEINNSIFYLLFFNIYYHAFNCICPIPKKTSGNPIFEGWYADPEAVILNKEYWVFPTFSAKYKDQIFFDAFSSKDLVNWKKS
jgi:hypothetical protein